MIITGLKRKVRAQLLELQKPENVKKFSVELAFHLNHCKKCARHFEQKGKQLDWDIIKCMVTAEMKGSGVVEK